jgi:hypothetical protein
MRNVRSVQLVRLRSAPCRLPLEQAPSSASPRGVGSRAGLLSDETERLRSRSSASDSMRILQNAHSGRSPTSLPLSERLGRIGVASPRYGFTPTNMGARLARLLEAQAETDHAVALPEIQYFAEALVKDRRRARPAAASADRQRGGTARWAAVFSRPWESMRPFAELTRRQTPRPLTRRVAVSPLTIMDAAVQTRRFGATGAHAAAIRWMAPRTRWSVRHRQLHATRAAAESTAGARRARLNHRLPPRL